MNIENTQSQMRKGVLEFCILSIIQREEAYPSDIIEEMKKAHLNILEGTLYPLLTRLKNADLLAYRWVESSGGPPRKYFSLTEKGAAFYKELEATWREMSDSVERVIGNRKELNLPAQGREVEEVEGLNLPAEGRGSEDKTEVQAEPEQSTNTEPSSTDENIHPTTDQASNS
jgi:PadR family transcriptional regulator PadR